MSELSTVLDEAFDTANEEGSPSFEPIPKGNYIASITDAKVGPLKSGKGQAISLTWEIQSGQYQGRLVFDRIIIAHESENAMRFGKRKLKNVADAVGIKHSITDLTVLTHKPVNVAVKIEQDAAGDYPPRNSIGRVKPIAKPNATANGNAKADFSDDIPF
jgi:hypothetical protein